VCSSDLFVAVCDVAKKAETPCVCEVGAVLE
jgi:hypothetical protein